MTQPIEETEPQQQIADASHDDTLNAVPAVLDPADGEQGVVEDGEPA